MMWMIGTRVLIKIDVSSKLLLYVSKHPLANGLSSEDMGRKSRYCKRNTTIKNAASTFLRMVPLAWQSTPASQKATSVELLAVITLEIEEKYLPKRNEEYLHQQVPGRN